MLGGVVAAILVAGLTATSASAATTLRVLSFNIWMQGSHGGIDAVVNEIRASGANVVALQESGGTATTDIATALGWNHTEPGWDIDVLSALPIEEQDWESWPDTGAQAIAAKISGVWVYSVHLDYTKYGPYNACTDHDSVETILADERNRTRQAEQITEWTASSAAILAGDFNSPSHLDWTAATAPTHCGYTIEWPTTKAFEAGGFADSFRTIHPDPAAVPGNTWSPEYPPPEPQDRIDYVLYRGVTATGSDTVGGGDGWPSDHLAVVSDFTLP
jgi:endonuclease/exonuclease/phosphatase (EEP) superfamily protein YafD